MTAPETNRSVRLERMEIRNFRNLEKCAINFTSGVNILTGPNGSGKTNILEAIGVLCQGRSQRLNAKDEALVGATSDFYRCQGTATVNGSPVDIAVAFQIGAGKKISLHGAPARASEIFRLFTMVWLAPEDTDLVSGGPETRRRFLDLHLAQSGVRYYDTLAQYQRALLQRNSHLKNFGLDESGTPFDDPMIEYGSRLTLLRAEFLARATETVAARYADISGMEGSLGLAYAPSALHSTEEYRIKKPTEDISSYSEEDIQKRFHARLESRSSAEAVRQITLVGPHRDDFHISIRGFPARTHGSQGEWRSAAIALKLAVYGFLLERTGQTPLLLLDEIFAELDPERQEAMGRLIKSCGQIFLSTALAPPEFIGAEALVLYVNAGIVRPG